MAQSSWEADKMLDVYIYDYLMKRNLHTTAKAFMTEGKVSLDPVAIDAPGGFLFEWWSVFWDIFIARTNDKHSEVAASYIETQQMKAREQVQQQQQQHQQQHQLHLQQLQLLQQRQAQQQHRRDANHSTLNGSSNAETLMVPSIANVMAAKMYEDQLKHPHQRDGLDEAASNPGQPSGSLLMGTAGNVTAPTQKVQVHSQQMPVNAQIKNEVGVVLNQRSPTADPSLFGVPGGTVHPKSNLLNSGINQGLDASPLKGWPLTGIDQLRSNLVQQGQNSFLQSPQQLQQFQLLTVQQQQRYLMQAQAQAQARAQAQAQAQAQANLTSSGSSVLGDMDHRRFRVLVRSGLTGMDGQPTGSDGSQALASPMQVTSPTGRTSFQDQMDLLIKVKMAQRQHQQSQTESQQQQLSPHSQHHQQEQQQPQQQQLQLVGIPQNQQQDRMDGVDSIPKGSNLPNSFQANEQNGRKRKQLSSSGPGNSSETGNTAGPPNSAPSTPSIHTPADVMSMAGTLQQSGSIPKNLMMYGSDETGGLASPSTQLADIGRFGEHGSLEDNVESFLSPDDGDPRDGLFGITKSSAAGHNMDVSKGFSFVEVGSLCASTSKVVCCHFSSDGKLLASAGHDKKAVLWNMDTLKLKSTFQEHAALITDVRFSPISTRLATSSFDKTVRVWDADSPSYSLRSFTGHSTSVMSLDFHTNNTDLLCSCDSNGEILYWNVSKGGFTRVSKGGMTQIRFQPRVGKLLAAAGENLVSVFDVETDSCVHTLKRHTKPVHSLCWDVNGDLIASVSEDSVRVWSLASGGECIHELICNGNKFHSCVFHPNYPSLLIIGCYESLELWNMKENKRMTVKAHDGLIAALAQCPATGMVASASHDKCVKLWK